MTLQITTLLDFQKDSERIFNAVYHKKCRFLVQKHRKALAVLVPFEDFRRYFEDPDVEIYTNRDIREFLEQDQLTRRQKAKVQNLLSRV